MPDYPSQPTIAEQQAWMRREIVLREQEFKIWVAEGLMPKQRADRELEIMRAVLANLERIMQ